MTKEYPSVKGSFPYESHQLAKWLLHTWVKMLQDKADAEKIALGKRVAEMELASIDDEDLALCFDDLEDEVEEKLVLNIIIKKIALDEEQKI